MENINLPNQENQNPTPTYSKTLKQEYQEALLKSGIEAAKLLNELIELKLMPDPRVNLLRPEEIVN